MADSQGHKIVHDIDSFLPDAREAIQHLDGHPPGGGGGLGDYCDPYGSPLSCPGMLCPIHGEGLLPFASPLFGDMDPFSVGGGSFGMGHGGIGIRMTMMSGMGGFRIRAQPFMTGHGTGMFGQSRQRTRFRGFHSARNNAGRADDGHTGPIITELPDDDDMEIDGNGTDSINAPGPTIVEIEEDDKEQDNVYEQHNLGEKDDFNEHENVKERADEPFYGPITSDISDYITEKTGTKNNSRSESVNEETVFDWQELDDECPRASLNSNEHRTTPVPLRQQPKNKNTGLKKSTIKKVNKNETVRPGSTSSPANKGGKERIESQFNEHDTNWFTSMDVPDGAQSPTEEPLGAQKLSKHYHNAPKASDAKVEANVVNFDSPMITPVSDQDIDTIYISADGSGMFTPDNDEQFDSNHISLNDSLVLKPDVDKNHEIKYMPANKRDKQLSDIEQSTTVHSASVRYEGVSEIADIHEEKVDSQMDVPSAEAVKQNVLVRDSIEHPVSIDSLGNQEASSAIEIENDSSHESNFVYNGIPLEDVLDSAINETAMANDAAEFNNAAMDDTVQEVDRDEMIQQDISRIHQSESDPSTVSDNIPRDNSRTHQSKSDPSTVTDNIPRDKNRTHQIESDTSAVTDNIPRDKSRTHQSESDTSAVTDNIPRDKSRTHQSESDPSAVTDNIPRDKSRTHQSESDPSTVTDNIPRDKNRTHQSESDPSAVTDNIPRDNSRTHQSESDPSAVTDNVLDLESVTGGVVTHDQTHSTVDSLNVNITDKGILYQVTATYSYDTNSAPKNDSQGDHTPKNGTQDTLVSVTRGTSEHEHLDAVQFASHPDTERASEIVTMNKTRASHHIPSYDSEDSSDDNSFGSYDCSNGGSSETFEGANLKGQFESESSLEENSEYLVSQRWEYPSEPWPTAAAPPHETECGPFNEHGDNTDKVFEAKSGFQRSMTREEMKANEENDVNVHQRARPVGHTEETVNAGRGHHEHHHVVPVSNAKTHCRHHHVVPVSNVTHCKHCHHITCPNCHHNSVGPHPNHSHARDHHARDHHVGGYHETDYHGLQDDDWELFDHPELQWVEEFADPGAIGKPPVKNKNQPKTCPHMSQHQAGHHGHGSGDGGHHGHGSGDGLTDIPGPARHGRQQPTGSAQSHQPAPINRSGGQTYYDRLDNLKQMVANEGFDIYDVHYDGNCLFEAVVDQLRIRDDFRYTVTTLREAAVGYLRDNPSQPDGTPLLSFLTDFDGSWEEYLSRLSLNGEWGDHITISAISNVLVRKLVILGGTTSLHRTEMEPLQAKLNSMANQDPSEEPSSQSKAIDSHVTQTGQYDVYGSEQEDLYLGHVFEAHYMSLRRRDWKHDLLERLKSKSTLPVQDSGTDPEGFPAVSQTDAPMPHLTFVTMYTKLSDYFKIGPFPAPPSASNSRFTGHLSLYDGMTSLQNFYSSPRWLYSWKIRMEVHDSRVHSPDAPLHSCGPKDLIVDSRNSLVTRLIPVKPSCWLKKAISVNGRVYLQQLFGTSPPRYEGGKGRADSIIMFPAVWPAESLQEYRNRLRPVNWPNHQTVLRVADMPCGMIPSTERSAGNHEELDWEYSFYNAERIIAEDAADSVQRFCYNVIMALINETLYPDKVDIVHLQHTFFHFCEETPQTQWTDDPVVCMLAMIDKLRRCYQAKVLPHYFMRHHNMLANWAGDADQMESILRVILRNPFATMYFMLDSHRVLYLDRTPVVDRIVEDIQKYRQHHDVRTSMTCCFLPLAVDGIGTYISSKLFNKVHEKSVQAINALESVSKESVNMTLDDLIRRALKSTERMLTRWLCAFVLDQNNGTEFTGFVNEEFPTVSVFHFFGRDLAEHLQTFHGDIMIPSFLVETSDLAGMAWEFMDVLERVVHIPRRAYCNSVMFFCQHHGLNIIEFMQNTQLSGYMKQTQLDSLKIIVLKNEIFHNEEEMLRITLLKEKLSHAYMARARELIDKQRPDQAAEVIQDAQVLLEEIKKQRQEWKQSSPKTTRV